VTTQITEAQRDEIRRRLDRRHDNAMAYEHLMNGHNLPASQRAVTPDAVLVSVARVEDLGEWLDQLGGEIHAAPLFEGVEMWVLHTSIEAWRDSARLPVLVSVTVLDRNDVVWDITERIVKSAVSL